MKNLCALYLLPLPMLLGLSGCEPAEEKEQEPEVIEYATLTVETATESEGGAVALTSSMCTSDADTGFFEGSFVADSGAMLTIKIKGFSTGTGSYTCTQASDNSTGEIGNKFDNCAIELVIPDVASSVNTYAMHRSDVSDKDFTYSGSCTIDTTYMEPQVQGTISCTGLVQTDYQGTARNPINPDVTADIMTDSSFFCDI
jgi:hypothetical protein